MRIHKSGKDNWTPKGKSGLTREYVHGRLEPSDDGNPMKGIWIGLAIVAPFWAFIGWLVL